MTAAPLGYKGTKKWSVRTRERERINHRMKRKIGEMARRKGGKGKTHGSSNRKLYLVSNSSALSSNPSSSGAAPSSAERSEFSSSGFFLDFLGLATISL